MHIQEVIQRKNKYYIYFYSTIISSISLGKSPLTTSINVFVQHKIIFNYLAYTHQQKVVFQNIIKSNYPSEINILHVRVL